MKIYNRFPTKTSPQSTKTEAIKTTAPSGNVENLALKAGSIIKGTVLEIIADGKALLDVGGRTITAQTMVPLKPNTELFLEVKEGGATPWLTLAGQKGIAQEIIRLLFGEGINITKAADLLTGSGETNAASTLPTDLLETLNNIRQEIGARSIGNQAETEKLTKLASLLRPNGKQSAPASETIAKQLSETVKIFASRLGDDHPAVKQLESMTRLLEAHQQINVPQSGNQPDYLLFPCFFAESNGWGEWMYQMTSEGKGEEKQPACAIDFFLQMSRLGDIHLKVLLQGENLRGDFYVGEESTRSHLAKALPQLGSILEGLGYRPSLTATHSTENLLNSFKKNLEEKAGLRPFSLVDITA